MAKISIETINNLREFMDRGCDYAGTQEMINDLVSETLGELGSNCRYGDEIGLIDYDGEFGNLEDFANLFWDKAVEAILNVLETEE